MKVRGKLPEVEPTPHHPDEVSPGHLRLDPARIEAAVEAHCGSEFAADDLLNLSRDSLKLIDKYFDVFQPVAQAYDLPADQVPMRIEEGFFLLDPEKLDLPGQALADLLRDVIAMTSFTDEETRTSMDNWAAQLVKDESVLNELARLNVNRDKELIDRKAAEAEVTKAVFWFVMHQIGTVSLSSFSAHLAAMIDNERWYRGVCPVCGNYPAMAGLVGDGGKRHLYCDTCGMVWHFARLQCPYCQNDDLDKLEVMNIDDKSPYSLDVCLACKRYVKTVDYRKADQNKAVLLPVEDASTVYLDLIAGEEGLHRE